MRLIPRLIPVSIYDITQVETYFSHMASKGCFVIKMWGNFATFEKRTPQKTKYRLEPYGQKGKEPPEDMRIYYEEQGWKYICKMGYFHLYQATREDATEIHTDPAIQAETFVNLNKSLDSYFWLSVFMFSLFGGMIIYSTLIINPVYFDAKYGSGFPNQIIIFLYLFLIWQTYQDHRKMKKIKEQLESGVKIVHCDRYKPTYRRYFIYAFPLVCAFLMFYSVHYSDKSYWYADLSTYEGNYPAIPITALETNLNFISPYDDEYEGNYENIIIFHWSAVAPEAYTVEEYGQIPEGVTEDNAEADFPCIKTEYYRMRFQFLAKILFREVIKDNVNRDFFETVQYHELHDTQFDQATLVLADDTQMFFARKGTKVVFIEYYGNENLETVVDNIYDAVNDFSKM
ncbi:hypothetical protein CLNEO_11870 [Anaerotignum neopropionicum]|uniref:DUF2812 domain-containing protein n=1 Tax=Anaerotignum neopropionicum TaxID=36847 RepID=A0A136WF94_9FIRM|nr:DUF2812 domain-containing protein [Anaerotignum neopropionicum]KXL53216.1 hypothetical protein CLNEO_11870 [Anaerotignum neopropionicum]